MQLIQVKVLRETGFDIVSGGTWGGYIVIPLPYAVGRWQKRPDLIVVERRCIIILVLVLALGPTVLGPIVFPLGVDDANRYWRWLYTRLLARYI